jgi:hypothetical protein
MLGHLVSVFHDDRPKAPGALARLLGLIGRLLRR